MKSILIIIWVLVLQVLRNIGQDPPEHVDGAVSLFLMRRLSHACWWKDNLCCRKTLNQCVVCSDRCQAGTYTQGVYAQPPNCQGCSRGVNPISSGFFSCQLTQIGTGITKTFQGNTGDALPVIASQTAVFTLLYPTFCGTFTCSTLTRTSGVNMDACLVSGANGEVTFNSNTCNVIGTAVYTYTCESGQSSFDYSPVSITLTCPAPGNVVQNGAGLVQSKDHPIDGTTPFFFVPQFSVTITSCPILSIAFYLPDKINPVLDMSPVPAIAPMVGAINYQSSLPNTDYTYSFSIKLTLQGGEIVWANIAGNDVFQLIVSCPTTVVVTTGAFPSQIPTLSNTQWIRNNPLVQSFILPTFIHSPNICPIINYQVSDQNGVLNVPAQFVVDPVSSGGNMIVRPSDDTLHQSYQFFVKISIKGGEVGWSPMMTLHVECSPLGISFTEDPLFLKNLTLYISGNTKDVYTIVPPITNLTYCNAKQFRITNLEKNSYPLSTAMVPAISCSGIQPCFKLDSQDFKQLQQITFKIETVLIGGFTKKSSTVIVTVLCDINSASMTSSILNSTQYIYTQFTDNRIYFKPFNCTPADCCVGLTYTVTKLSASPGNLKDYIYQPILVTDQNSTHFGNYSIEPYTGDRYNFTFDVHLKNLYNTEIASKVQSIEVKYNCSFDRMWYKTSRPIEGEYPDHVIYQNLNETDPKNHSLSSWLVANYTVRTVSLHDIRFDLSSRIFTNATEFCPDRNFKIEKVIDATSGLPLSKHQRREQLVMYKNGTLDLYGINNQVQYFLWISVFNGVADLTFHQPAIFINTSYPTSKPLNHPPFFEVAPRTVIYVNLTEQRNKNKEKFFELPEVLDANFNDTWTIKINPKNKYFFFRPQQGLVFNFLLFEKKNLGVQSFTILLADSAGEEVKYPIKLFVFKDDPVIEEEAEEEEKEEPPRSFYARQNVTAFIESISVFGEMIVRFNSSMKVDFEASSVNTSLVDIYVVPNGRDENYNMTLINLTWSLQNISSYKHHYKLNFLHPLQISPYKNQDEIVFHLKNDSEAFFSKGVQNYLHKASWTMRKKIRRNLQDDTITRQTLSNSNSAAGSSVGLLVAGLLFNLVASSKGFRYYMWYLRGAQIVCHLTMFSTVVPANVSSFFENLIPFVQFDILDPEWTTMIIFDFDFKKHRKLSVYILDQMQDLGYETHSSILTLGSIWIFACFYLLKLFVFLMLHLIKWASKGKYKFKFLQQWQVSLIFNELLQLMIDGYIEWIIAGYLNVKHPVYTYFGDQSSNFTGYVALFIWTILVPFSLLMIIFLPIDKIRNNWFQKAFAFFFEDIKTTNKYYMSYFVFWIGRRLVFISLALFLEVSSMQIFSMLMMNLFFHIFAAKYPFNDRYLNRHGMVEEMILQFHCLHLMHFTDYVQDPEDQLLFGWSMIGLTVAHLLYQSLILLVQMLLQAFKVMLKLWKWFLQKYDKKMEYDAESYLKLLKMFKVKELSEKVEEKFKEEKLTTRSYIDGPLEMKKDADLEKNMQKSRTVPLNLLKKGQKPFAKIVPLALPTLTKLRTFIELDDTAFVSKTRVETPRFGQPEKTINALENIPTVRIVKNKSPTTETEKAPRKKPKQKEEHKESSLWRTNNSKSKDRSPKAAVKSGKSPNAKRPPVEVNHRITETSKPNHMFWPAQPQMKKFTRPHTYEQEEQKQPQYQGQSISALNPRELNLDELQLLRQKVLNKGS